MSDGRPDKTADSGRSRCQVCGESLQYMAYGSAVVCRVCGSRDVSNIACAAGHYVCATCHGQEYYAFVAGHALAMTSQDPMAIGESLLREAALPAIGSEYHAIPATALLAALRNYGEVELPGGERRVVGEEDLREGIRRARQLPACACAYLGTCGAGMAAGIVFSILLQAHCETDVERSLVMRATGCSLAAIANGGSACCKQSVRLSILTGSQLLKENFRVYLPISRSKCSFATTDGSACKGARCSFWR